MPLIASESSSLPRTLAPAGTHVGRCVQVIDLGTQDDTYQGKPKINHKVRITWELPHELYTFDDQKGPEPFFVSKKYTLSLGEQANLRADLESWRGRQFNEEELKGFDLKNVLGAPCQISIIHKAAKNSGKIREEVTAVIPLPKGMVAPGPIKPQVYYEVEMGRNDVYNSLPPFLREDIAKCHEWRNPEPESQEPSGEPQFSEPGSTEIDNDLDSIPF